MIYIGNAFSLQMVGETFPCQVSINEVTSSEVPQEGTSCIGHVDTAQVVSNILGVTIPMNRINVSLKRGDVLYVAQIMGGRLPEGATQLPEGFMIKFLRVELV